MGSFVTVSSVTGKVVAKVAGNAKAQIPSDISNISRDWVSIEKNEDPFGSEAWCELDHPIIPFHERQKLIAG